MGNGGTLVIADRDRFMVEALASVLDGQPDLEILGTAYDAKGAEEAIVDHRPAVAILDGDLAFENGENLVSRLRKMSLSTGIVFIGSRMDPTALAEFIFADPAGRAFIRKSDIGSVDKLVRTIKSRGRWLNSAGRRYFSALPDRVRCVAAGFHAGTYSQRTPGARLHRQRRFQLENCRKAQPPRTHRGKLCGQYLLQARRKTALRA